MPTPTGLVAAYGFNEGSGSVLNDLSGNGNNGTILDAAWVTSGKFGSALTFNGVDSAVVVNDSPSLHLTKTMTLEAWVYPVNSIDGWRSILMKQMSTDASYYLEANTQYNMPASSVSIKSEQILAGGSKLPLFAWSHLATTYDGAYMRLYISGTQVSARAQTGTIQNAGGQLLIGGNTIWGEYFSGRIDEVRIYNRALSGAQIQADMNNPVTGAN